MSSCILLLLAIILCDAYVNKSTGPKRLTIAYVSDSKSGKQSNDTGIKFNGQHQKTRKPDNKSDACDCRSINTLSKPISSSDYSVEQKLITDLSVTPTEKSLYTEHSDNSSLSNEYNSVNEYGINANNQSAPTPELRENGKANSERYFKISKKALFNVLNKCNFPKKVASRLYRTGPVHKYNSLDDLLGTIGNGVNMGINVLTNIRDKIKGAFQGTSGAGNYHLSNELSKLSKGIQGSLINRHAINHEQDGAKENFKTEMHNAGEKGSGGGEINIGGESSSYLDDENSFFDQDIGANGKFIFLQNGNANGRPFTKIQVDGGIDDYSEKGYNTAVQDGTKGDYKVEIGIQGSNKNKLNLLTQSDMSELFGEDQVNADRNLNTVGRNSEEGSLNFVQKGSASTNLVNGDEGLDVKMTSDEDEDFNLMTHIGTNFNGKDSIKSNIDLAAQDYVTFISKQINKEIKNNNKKTLKLATDKNRGLNNKHNLAGHGNEKGYYFAGGHHNGEAGLEVGVQSNGGGGKVKSTPYYRQKYFTGEQSEAGESFYYLPHNIVKRLLNLVGEDSGKTNFGLTAQSKLGDGRFATKHSVKFSAAEQGKGLTYSDIGMLGKEVNNAYIASQSKSKANFNIDNQRIAKALYNLVALGFAGGVLTKVKGHYVDAQKGGKNLRTHDSSGGGFNFREGNSANHYDPATDERDFNRKVPSVEANNHLNVAAHSKAEDVNVARGQQFGGLGHKVGMLDNSKDNFNVNIQKGGMGNSDRYQGSVQSLSNHVTKHISNGRFASGQANRGGRFNIREKEKLKFKVQDNGRNIGRYNKIGSQLNGGGGGNGQIYGSVNRYINAGRGFESEYYMGPRDDIGVGFASNARRIKITRRGSSSERNNMRTKGNDLNGGISAVHINSVPRSSFDINRNLSIDTESRSKTKRLGKIREGSNFGRLVK